MTASSGARCTAPDAGRPGGVVHRRYGRDDLPTVQDLLAEVYAEVYADELANPFTSIDRFVERLGGHAVGPRWEVVVGYERIHDGGVDRRAVEPSGGHRPGAPVGFAYGCTVRADSSWWNGVQPLDGPDRVELTPEFTAETGDRTLALFELMVRRPWRGIGAARRIHDELLRGRPEQRVALSVNADHPRVRALYERWGYRAVGVRRPFADGPLLVRMVGPVDPGPSRPAG